MSSRKTFLKTIAAAAIMAAFGSPASVFAQAQGVDLSPEQPGRPRSQPLPEVQKLVPKDFRFVKEGTLVVGTTVSRLPLNVYSTDMKTPVGHATDMAQLIADSLGRKLEMVVVAWADWTLGLASGKFDIMLSNVTVTEERKEKFDFSTYRQDNLGIYVPTASRITAIKEPKDIAGLRVIVQPGTNQEQILLRWNQQNVAAGLKPVQTMFFEDEVASRLALQSGRADASFAPNAVLAWEARKNELKLAGTFSGGWPLAAEIGVATRKGSGMAEAMTAAINAQIRNGNYAKTLQRWSLESEAVTEARTNPPGLPKK